MEGNESIKTKIMFLGMRKILKERTFSSWIKSSLDRRQEIEERRKRLKKYNYEFGK